MSGSRVLGVLGLIGGLSGMVLAFAFAATGWGEPGTATYRTYETLNRLTGIALLLMAGGWLGMALALPSGYGRAGAWLAFISGLVMVVGNGAEFWLFTDLPYGDPTNARSLSWMVYSFGDLFQTIGVTIVGVNLWHTGIWPKASALVLILALPISVAGFVSVSPFLGPAIQTLVIGWNLIRSAPEVKITERNRVSS